MSVTSYEIIGAKSVGDFTSRVSAAIAEGKQPLGTPYVFDGVMYQAVYEGSQDLSPVATTTIENALAALTARVDDIDTAGTGALALLDARVTAIEAELNP